MGRTGLVVVTTAPWYVRPREDGRGGGGRGGDRGGARGGGRGGGDED